MARDLIVVSGYYGFDNLGDEAILEELVTELSQMVSREQIVVLSQNPQATAEKFGVRSVDRWQLGGLIPIFSQARLFISGGGGLFQDSQSSGSVIYYGGLICLAKVLGAKSMIYAQGLGPLHRSVSQFVTKAVFNLTDAVTLRDQKSMAMLESWGQNGQLTEDPVWLLKAGPISAGLSENLKNLKQEHKLLVGLSLRRGGGFDSAQINALATTLDLVLPKAATVVCLPLQKELDEPALTDFAVAYRALGRDCQQLNFDELTLPSQWLTLLSKLDLVVGMRLHALIMALSGGVPVVGIAYDPKVTRVLNQFKQANLAYVKDNLTVSESEKNNWRLVLQKAIENKKNYATIAREEAAKCRILACQNPAVLAKILS